MNIKCLKKKILFQFVQMTASGGFANTTDWGFEIKNRVEDISTPRWGMVKAVGDGVKAVHVGDYILVEPLMWTLSFTHEGEKYWATAEEKVFGTSQVAPSKMV